MKPFLSIKEASEYLGLEYKTVYRLVRAGELPAARLGGVYRIKLTDLEQYFEQQKQRVGEHHSAPPDAPLAFSAPPPADTLQGAVAEQAGMLDTQPVSSILETQDMSEKLIHAIADMQEETALALAKQMLDSGADPLSILENCRAAMEIVGKRFEQGDYFLPELIMAGELLNQIAALVKPRLAHAGETQKRARIVLGTVQGDIHDIGKDIISFMLDVNGFEVHDLGVDVPAQKFVDAVAELKPQILALSGFLTVAFQSMKETIAAIQAAGLRDQVKIMIGGGTVDENVRVYTGADGYGSDAMAGVALARAWASAGATE